MAGLRDATPLQDPAPEFPEAPAVPAGTMAPARPIRASPFHQEPTLPRDLVCFSHLRWDFVYQRPNHLMARAARDRRVFFVEEPRLEAVTACRASNRFAARA